MMQRQVKLKPAFKIKLVLGMVSLFIMGTISMLFVVNTVIRNIIYDNMLANTRNEKLVYTHKIDNLFNMANERINTLTRVLEALPSIDYFEGILQNVVGQGEKETVFVGLSDGRTINGTGWVPHESWRAYERPWYQQAKLAGPGEIIITDPYLSYATGLLSVGMAKYVPNIGGIGGVVVTAIPLPQIEDMISGYGYFFLTSHEGDMILSPAEGFSIDFDPAGPLQELALLEDGSYLLGNSLEGVEWNLFTIVPRDLTQQRVGYYTTLIMVVLTVVLLLLFLILTMFLVKTTKGLEEKRLSEIRFKAMLDSSPVACAICDENFNFLKINKSGLDMFEITDEAEFFRDPMDLSPKYQPDGSSSRDLALHYHQKVLEEGKVHFEWLHQTVGGTLIPSDVTLAKAFLDGKPHNIVYIKDLRGEKEMVSKLADAYAKAQTASQAKTTFFANMSHEIRTPMNAIMGMAAIGKNYSDNRKKDYAFERIKGASSHLLGIINDVLDMSKIEAGKFELYATEFELESIFRKAVDMVEPSYAKKWQRLFVYLDPSLPQFVVADEQKLTQVMANLLSNAVKFTPNEGSITVSAFLVEAVGELATIQVEVLDTGIGISPKRQELIFNSYEQADREIANKFSGTGLGLAISKKIIEASGGQIWVDSKPGEGSAFTFRIHVQTGNKAIQPEAALPLPVLIVHGLSRTRGYFKDWVQKLGGEPDMATYQDEVFAKGPYPLCFVDGEMEQANGIELALKIKEQWPKSLVVVLISSYQWVGIEESEGLEILMKPFFPSDIRHYLVESRIPALLISKTKEKHPPQFLKGFTMLLAEDIEINREIVQSLLKTTGIHIEMAENGRQAVELFAKAPTCYHVILMDLHMPQMNGLEATRQIRAINSENAKTVPILAMTANVFQVSIDECMAAGMTGHISKPLDLEAVTKALKDALGL